MEFYYAGYFPPLKPHRCLFEKKFFYPLCIASSVCPTSSLYLRRKNSTPTSSGRSCSLSVNPLRDRCHHTASALKESQNTFEKLLHFPSLIDVIQKKATHILATFCYGFVFLYRFEISELIMRKGSGPILPPLTAYERALNRDILSIINGLTA